MPESGAHSNRTGRSPRWLRLAPVPLTLASLLVVSACGGDDDGDGSVASGDVAAADLDGRTFRSTGLAGHTLVDGSIVELTFEDGRVIARAGCNTMSGAATLGDGTLSVSADGLATTQMGCPAELQAQDEWVAALLTSEPSLALEGTTLVIGDDALGMTLEERADLGLLETTWKLSELRDSSSVSSIPAGMEASITIDAAGTQMALAAGCNTGSAPVTVQQAANASSGVITIGAVATTKKLCEDDVMAAEAHVLAVLEGDVTFLIQGEKLTLTNGDDGLAFTGSGA